MSFFVQRSFGRHQNYCVMRSYSDRAANLAMSTVLLSYCKRLYFARYLSTCVGTPAWYLRVNYSRIPICKIGLVFISRSWMHEYNVSDRKMSLSTVHFLNKWYFTACIRKIAVLTAEPSYTIWHGGLSRLTCLSSVEILCKGSLWICADLVGRVRNGETPAFRPTLPSSDNNELLVPLMKDCWEERTESRPTFSDIKRRFISFTKGK